MELRYPRASGKKIEEKDAVDKMVALSSVANGLREEEEKKISETFNFPRDPNGNLMIPQSVAETVGRHIATRRISANADAILQALIDVALGEYREVTDSDGIRHLYS